MKNLFKTFLLSAFCLFGFQVLADTPPALSSFPASTYVLYLDFDGHSDNSGWWSSTAFPDPVVTAASTFTVAQMTEVFNRVSEDYRPFDINVTTQASVYNAATAAKRQRIVITATSQFYTDENGGAGGVAYLNTFGGGEIAGYVFSNFLGGSAKNVGEAASHEAGHTLGLNHHSRFLSAAGCAYDIEYNPGQGSGETDWAPIMGNGYGANMTLWYHGATNGSTCTSSTQNDVSVITTNNGFTYRVDEAGNTLALATTLSLTVNPTIKSGIITTAADVDVYKIVISTAGIYSFSGVPRSHNASGNSGANLDIKLWVTNSGGTILATADPATTLNASISNLTLAAGTYYVFLDGVGISNYTAVGGLGSLDYGSIGEYTLTVTKACTPVITGTTPGNRCGTGTVTLGAATTDGTINWYANSSGGNSLGTGISFVTPSISGTTTYFAGAIAAGCSTASARVAAIATVTALPNTNAGSDQTVNQNSGNLTLSGTPAGGSWSGTSVTTGGVFNSNVAAGTYKLAYCATNGNCSKCDSVLVTVLTSETVVAKPVITPGTGTYGGPQNVTITCGTIGASIYYTTTGNTPVVGTGFTKLYTGSFVVSQSQNVKAIGVKTGLTTSFTASVFITLTEPSIVETPVITPATGTYNGQQTGTITCATAGATIYYTTSGNIPSTTVNSFTKIYTGSFPVNSSMTIRALGVKSGRTNSAVAVSFITLAGLTPTVATPVITPGTGTFAGPQTVSISCATPASTIYYTTSGNNPIIGAGFTKVYSGAFLVSTTTTVRAMATAAGFNNSAIPASFLTITGGRAMVSNEVAEENSIDNTLNFANVVIYPNPSNGIFNLELSDLEKECEVVVFDMKGRRILELSKINQSTKIDLSSFQSGVYSLRIDDGKQVRTVRLMKE